MDELITHPGVAATWAEHKKLDIIDKGFLEMPQLEIPIVELKTPTLYYREMQMPAGSIVTGKIYKRDHLCVLLKGTVKIWRDSGTFTMEAPVTFEGYIGARRLFYAETDVHFAIIISAPTISSEDIEDFLYIEPNNPKRDEFLRPLLEAKKE